MNHLAVTSPELTNENTIQVKVKAKDPTTALGSHSFGVSYSYQVPQPEPNFESPLSLTASQTNTESLKKVTISIENKTEEVQGMLMCIISLQTGLKANLNDLEGLRRNEVVDFYELRNSNSEVILYWRGMAEGASRGVQLSFLKEFEVKNALPTLVSAYLYYDKSGSLISQLL